LRKWELLLVWPVVTNIRRDSWLPGVRGHGIDVVPVVISVLAEYQRDAVAQVIVIFTLVTIHLFNKNLFRFRFLPWFSVCYSHWIDMTLYCWFTLFLWSKTDKHVVVTYVVFNCIYFWKYFRFATLSCWKTSEYFDYQEKTGAIFISGGRWKWILGKLSLKSSGLNLNKIVIWRQLW